MLIAARARSRLPSRVVHHINRRQFGISRSLINRPKLPWFTFFTSFVLFFSLLCLSLWNEPPKENVQAMAAQSVKDSLSALNLAALHCTSDEKLAQTLKVQTGEGLEFTLIGHDFDDLKAFEGLSKNFPNAAHRKILYYGMNCLHSHLERIYESPEKVRHVIVLPDRIPGLNTGCPDAIAIKAVIHKLASEKDTVIICSEDIKAILGSHSNTVLVKTGNGADMAILAGALVSAYPALRNKDVPEAMEGLIKRFPKTVQPHKLAIE